MGKLARVGILNKGDSLQHLVLLDFLVLQSVHSNSL